MFRHACGSPGFSFSLGSVVRRLACRFSSVSLFVSFLEALNSLNSVIVVALFSYAVEGELFSVRICFSRAKSLYVIRDHA